MAFRSLFLSHLLFSFLVSPVPHPHFFVLPSPFFLLCSHPPSRLSRPQDAFEYFQYIMQLIDRADRRQESQVSQVFTFDMENRLECKTTKVLAFSFFFFFVCH